ncbi:MAG: hypothetical protein ACI4TI_00060, partial [Christensenellales bacterium]
PNLWFRRPTLYPIELTAHIKFKMFFCKPKRNQRFFDGDPENWRVFGERRHCAKSEILFHKMNNKHKMSSRFRRPMLYRTNANSAYKI